MRGKFLLLALALLLAGLTCLAVLVFVDGVPAAKALPSLISEPSVRDASAAPALSVAAPAPSCPPYHSQSFPGSSYQTFPPPGRVFCFVIIHDAGGRFDFANDGCFISWCVTGLHRRTVLKVTAPGEMEAVTVFAHYKRWLPVQMRAARGGS